MTKSQPACTTNIIDYRFVVIFVVKKISKKTEIEITTIRSYVYREGYRL